MVIVPSLAAGTHCTSPIIVDWLRGWVGLVEGCGVCRGVTACDVT